MDYYKILGVDKSASAEDIKQAYRKLAMKHHPDRGGNVSEFQKIQEAYNTLSDPKKKSEYDNPPQQAFHQFTGAPPSFEDIFAHFGNMGPFGEIFGRRAQTPKNKTLNVQTQISLEDAFTGKEVLATIQLPSGKEQTIEIKIPPGIQNGTTLRLAGMGDDSHTELPRGDLNITVQIAPHPRFQRQGDDLVCDLEINCIDAILGKTVLVDTIDGRTFEVKINPGTQPGQMLSIQGQGMPNMRDNRFKGRLLININIVVPTNITDEQKDILKKYFS